MKYLLTYIYDGTRDGIPVNGPGCITMTVTGTDKITPKMIVEATEQIKKECFEKGVKVGNVVPMGWFKFDEEDEE